MRSFVRYAPAFAAALSVSLVGCKQETESPTSPVPAPALDATAASALSFAGMTAGLESSCGLTSDSRGYCWGLNNGGQLGDGTRTNRSTPVPVAGGLRFRQLSNGLNGTTCAVTTDHRAYCWGFNVAYAFGNGTATQSSTPVAVAGGHSFLQVETSNIHTCGVSYPDGKAWCWGSNEQGEVGNGTTSAQTTPVAVKGGLTFSHITTGEQFTCGVTTSHKIYCWGLNNYGQLGDGTTTRRLTPRLVTGGLAFTWVDAGRNHTCAVTTDHRAFCWGAGRSGQRGDGGITERVSSPRVVFGNHLFTKLSAGGIHTCGVTTTNQAWCWGENGDGRLGDGTTTRRLTPHLVAGGHAFNQVSSGSGHTCARTTTGVGYCWGESFNGETGNGTTGEFTTPVQVE